MWINGGKAPSERAEDRRQEAMKKRSKKESSKRRGKRRKLYSGSTWQKSILQYTVMAD